MYIGVNGSHIADVKLDFLCFVLHFYHLNGTYVCFFIILCNIPYMMDHLRFVANEMRYMLSC